MSKIQEMTVRGIHMKAGLEAFVPAPYKDIAGVWTIYVGHTASAGPPNPAAMDKAMPADWREKVAVGFALMDDDLDKFEGHVRSQLKGPLEPHEFDGWVIWHYNTGGIFQTSAVAMWNRGDKIGAVRKLQQWNKVTDPRTKRKRVSQTLVDRRADEANLILRGVYKNPPVPVYGTNNNGKVIWKRIGTISLSEVQRLTRRENGSAPAPKPPRGKSTSLATAIGAALAAAGAAVATQWDYVMGWFPW